MTRSFRERYTDRRASELLDRFTVLSEDSPEGVDAAAALPLLENKLSRVALSFLYPPKLSDVMMQPGGARHVALWTQPILDRVQEMHEESRGAKVAAVAVALSYDRGDAGYDVTSPLVFMGASLPSEDDLRQRAYSLLSNDVASGLHQGVSLVEVGRLDGESDD